MKSEMFTQSVHGEMIVVTPAVQSFKINISPLKRPVRRLRRHYRRYN